MIEATYRTSFTFRLSPMLALLAAVALVERLLRRKQVTRLGGGKTIDLGGAGAYLDRAHPTTVEARPWR